MTDEEQRGQPADRNGAHARIDAILEKIAIQQAKAEVRQREADARHKEADVRQAKIDAKLTRLEEMYGGGNSQGAAAEEFYHDSLKANPVLVGIRFDVIEKRTRSHAGLEDEFDLLLINSRDVFVLEVKYKAHEKDPERLLNRKKPDFQRLFPEYGDHRQHFALATLHIDDALKAAAREQGVIVLQRKGDVIETLPADH